MKRICLLFVMPLLLVISCNSDPKHSSDYQNMKTSLQSQEISSPTSFLEFKTDAHKNLLGQWVIEGTIMNSATLATYKNILVKLTYVDVDGKTISKENQAIEGDIRAGGSLDFKIKRPNIRDARNVVVSLVSAEGQNP